MQYPIATISMENGRRIRIELRPDQAPNTVASFIYLANSGCFDHYPISRIVPGYVVDVSYTAFGKEQCKYLIANESRCCGFPNQLRVEPGVIAMGGYPQGIAGGEFFFPLDYFEKLNGHYPAFGVILEGLDEVLRWGNVPVRPVPYPECPEVQINSPIEPILIQSVCVETFGQEFPHPVKLPMLQLPPSW